ncbi:MAG: hypothetical protein IAE80_18420 [Anaerolinea sp.]|nr:hypothetical protein [Anaerolinea sp.]
MSTLIDLILEQRIILVTLVVAVLLGIGAVGIWVIITLREARKKREPLLLPLFEEEPVPEEVPLPPPTPVLVKPAPKVEKPTDPAPEVPAVLQNLLSNVFVDDDANQYRATLLKGLTDVDIKMLTELAEKAAAKLREREGRAS